MPKWKQLGLPVIGFFPENSVGNLFDETACFGKSAHSGRFVFERFIAILENLLARDYERVILAEYDTLNMRNEIPEFNPGHCSSWSVLLPPHGGACGPDQLCCFSPWMFDRKSAAEFIDAGKKEIETDPDCSSRLGLLDRWIGKVVSENKIPILHPSNVFGWAKHEGWTERVKRFNPAWVHGWKNKSDYGDLWPTQK
jgi:hypothetical protein